MSPISKASGRRWNVTGRSTSSTAWGHQAAGGGQAAIPSITINSLLPHKLADMAQTWGGRVIHFSTDCVFSGKRGGYTEQDDSDAEDLYGKSKFLGEVAAANALTLRTSIIGRELVEHRSLLDWFLAQNHKTVKGFRRVIYSGVTTNQMAEVVADIIRNHPTLCGPLPGGCRADLQVRSVVFVARCLSVSTSKSCRTTERSRTAA